MKDLDDLIKKYEKLPQYEIAIGVFSEHNDRTDEEKTVGLTNAEIMFINENGSPSRKIPARPVLGMTIGWAKEKELDYSINKALEEYNKTQNIDSIEKELNKLCMRMENYARDIIYSNDGRLAPNAPSVALAKGGNYPLHNTGQLARSITCKLIKSGE